MTDAETIAGAKRALRVQARALRAAIPPARRRWAAEELTATGLAFLSFPTPAVVAGYHPLGDEIDVLPLLARAASEGAVTALPAHARDRATLTFHRWGVGEALEKGEHGVMMPARSAERVEPDILLVPVLAFDAAGHRLGYGAGYFDQGIERLRALKKLAVVGVAFDEQEVAHVPHEPWDQRLDWLLTPSGPRPAEG